MILEAPARTFYIPEFVVEYWWLWPILMILALIASKMSLKYSLRYYGCGWRNLVKFILWYLLFVVCFFVGSILLMITTSLITIWMIV